MTYEELLAKINHQADTWEEPMAKALRAVVELHKQEWNESYIPMFVCINCFNLAHQEIEVGKYKFPTDFQYPCPTIQAIEKELN